MVEKQCHEETLVDQHPIPAGEVVVAGVTAVGDEQITGHLSLLLVSPFLAGVFFVANRGILQMLAQVVVGNFLTCEINGCSSILKGILAVSYVHQLHLVFIGEFCIYMQCPSVMFIVGLKDYKEK